VIGAPFYLTEHMAGTTFSQASPAHFGTDDRRAISAAVADALAQIHRIEWEQTPLREFARTTGYIERQVLRFTTLMDELQARPIPELYGLAELLRKTRPESGQSTLIHGDFRLGNLMFTAHGQPRILAIFDWELSSVGDPLADLGWLTALWAESGDPAGITKLGGATCEGGYLSRSALASRYGETSCRDVHRLGWYQAFAIWRLGVIMEGNFQRFVRGTSVDAFAAEFAGDIPELAQHAIELVLADG
jgi:aminoglycoside phosphotransferase (APT) family kinase protein